MKISELRQSVLDMNDGEEPDYATSIMTAGNLALNHLTRIIPSIGRATIEQDRPIYFEQSPTAGNAYVCEGVKGISFMARGSGSVAVNGETVKAWSGYMAYTPVRLVPPTETVSLTFSDLTGAVINLGFFGNIQSAAQIPLWGEYVAYDMSALTDDYISFYSSPSREGGDVVEGCIYRGSHLLVPASERGRITVSYRRKPARITLDTVENDGIIDVDRECEDLLELLVMYYVLASDGGSESLRKASLYLNQFNTMAALANAQRRKDRNDRVYTLYGW